MFHLVSTVMAISLAALAIGTGGGWISMSVVPRREAATLAASGFEALAAAATAYRIANGAMPSAAPNGRLPADLVPAYVEPPRAPHGMEWSYGVTEGNRAWVCLHGPAVSEPQWEGLAVALRSRPAGSAGLVSAEGASGACGARVSAEEGEGDLAVGDPPGTFPVPAFMTFNLFH